MMMRELAHLKESMIAFTKETIELRTIVVEKIQPQQISPYGKGAASDFKHGIQPDPLTA